MAKLIVSRGRPVLFDPIQVELAEVVQRYAVGCGVNRPGHQFVELLLRHGSIFPERDAAAVDGAIERAGLLTAPDFRWPTHAADSNI